MTHPQTKSKSATPARIEKACTKCKEVKPLSQFRADTRYKLGVSSRCKKCCSRGSRKPEPVTGATQEERYDVNRIIRGSRKLAIRLNEYLRDNATTQEARRNYYHAINNLHGGVGFDRA